MVWEIQAFSDCNQPNYHMKPINYLIIVLLLFSSCAQPIYLVGVDSNPDAPTQVFYIPVVNEQVPKEDLDTTKHTAEKIFKVLSAALIKDFGNPTAVHNTALPSGGKEYSYQYADWDGDGIKDLFAINRQGYTATDIHILSGASGFQGFLLQQPIGIPRSDAHTDFSAADVNKDGSTDLLVFERRGNESVKLTILSGKVSNDSPAFMYKLYETSLPFSDPQGSRAFEMYDVNQDGVYDLVVIDRDYHPSGQEEETKVLVYSGVSEFQTLMSNSVTPLHHNCNDCTFTMGEFLAENTLDLIAINDSQPEHTTIDVLSGANKFLGFIKQDSLSLDPSFKDAVFFSDKNIPVMNASTGGLETTFNSRPILKNASGPQHLHDFIGQWELNSTFHSSDNNSRTGIVINERALASNLEADGWEGITITFEDGYTITCEGKDGNVVCSEDYNLASVHLNYFYLVDTLGNHDKIEKYIENSDSGFLIFHNGAAYDAHVWGSWTEIGFGGAEKKVNTEKFYLSMAGGLDFIDIHDEHVFIIPKSAKNIQLFIDPVDGREKIVTISNPPIDNGCYRLRGDLLSAAFSSHYKYYDRDCEGSSNSRRIGKAVSFQNTDLFKVLSNRFKKLESDGFFSSLHSNDPNLHEKVRKEIFNTQVKEAIANHNATVAVDSEGSGSIFNSYSIGFGGAAEIVIGYSGDSGVIHDPGEGLERIYYSNGVTVGADIGAELAIVVGFWKQHVSEMSSGWSFGGGAGLAFIVGASVMAWDSSLGGETTGITFSYELGAEGRAFELEASYTTVGPAEPDN